MKYSVAVLQYFKEKVKSILFLNPNESERSDQKKSILLNLTVISITVYICAYLITFG